MAYGDMEKVNNIGVEHGRFVVGTISDTNVWHTYNLSIPFDDNDDGLIIISFEYTTWTLDTRVIPIKLFKNIALVDIFRNDGQYKYIYSIRWNGRDKVQIQRRSGHTGPSDSGLYFRVMSYEHKLN